MEFKDRVANKPNRVKLTYEDSGVSSYAVVELADEPVEEGTPLNALNMNKLLNKENNDYIIEQGTSGGFTWEKWNSGKVIFYGKLTASYINPNVLGKKLNFPFKIFDYIALGTLNEAGRNLSGALHRNVKIDALYNDYCEVYVHDALDNYTVTSVSKVSVEIKGKWK